MESVRGLKILYGIEKTLPGTKKHRLHLQNEHV